MIDLSQETEALAPRLAEAQSVTVDDVVRQALEARAVAAGVFRVASKTGRECATDSATARQERMDRIMQEIAAMPVLDRRSPREIVDDLNAL